MSKQFTVTTGCSNCKRNGFKNIGGHYAKNPACNAAHLRARAAEFRKVANGPSAAGSDYWMKWADINDAKAAELEGVETEDDGYSRDLALIAFRKA